MEYSFIEWMKIGIFIVIVVIFVMVLWLVCGIKIVGNIDLFELGYWIKVEKWVFVIFGMVVLVWIF